VRRRTAPVCSEVDEGCLSAHVRSSLSAGQRDCPQGIRIVRVSPGWVETEAAIALAERLAKQAGTDYEGGKQIIIRSLGGIPLERPAKPRECKRSWWNCSHNPLSKRP